MTLAGFGQSVHTRVETGSLAETGRGQLPIHMETPLCKPARLPAFLVNAIRTFRITLHSQRSDQVNNKDNHEENIKQLLARFIGKSLNRPVANNSC